MTVYLLIGQDPVARERTTTHILGNPSPEHLERFDIAADGGFGLAEAATTPSLFGTRRGVVGSAGQHLTAASATWLAKADPALPVVIHADQPPCAAVRQALPDAQVTRCALPKRRAAPQWVRTTGMAAGVVMPNESCWSLADYACDPVGAHRIDTTVRLLAALNLTKPSPDQVGAFLGSGAPSPVWRLTDAVESGNAAAALHAAELLDTGLLLSAMANRWIRLGHLLEVGDTASVPGLSPSAGAHALRAARRLGAQWVDAAVLATCRAQRRTRSGVAKTTARLLVCDLIAELALAAAASPPR